MKGVDLAANCSAVVIDGAVQILVAIAPAQRLHSAHPKMIGVGAQDMDSLTESQFDLEPVAIKQKYFEGSKGEVGGKEEDGTAMGMADDHETDETRSRTPEQIHRAGPERDVAF